MRVLKKGDQGPDVKAMQEALNAKAAAGIKPIPITSVFDEATEQALIEFQKRCGLTADGVFEEKTRAALFPLVACTVQIVGRKNAPGAPPAPPPPLEPAKPATFTVPTLQQPLPTLASPAPEGFHLDNYQFQSGYQHGFKPWYQLHSPSPNPSDSLFLTVQGTFLRSSEDRHLEITSGLTLQAPLSASLSDGNNWSLQYFVQFTAADVFWHYGRVHLASPFAQFSFQHGLGYPPANPTFGMGLYPVNLSVDILRTKDGDPLLSVVGQAGVVSSYNLSNDHFEIGPGVGIGLSVQLGAKKKK